MKTYHYTIQKISPYGLINIAVEVKEILPSKAHFRFMDNGGLIGTITCEVGNILIFEATNFIIEGYLKSKEFKNSRKEAGIWN